MLLRIGFQVLAYVILKPKAINLKYEIQKILCFNWPVFNVFQMLASPAVGDLDL